MEQQSPDFYERVAEGYRELARREPDRVRIVNASPSAEEVESEIWRLVQTEIQSPTLQR
jgi:thymidylate kinase